MIGSMSADSKPELLEFLAPGLLHGLGNALFRIQGHARLLGSEEILAACHSAVETVEIYRQVLDPALPAQRTAAGPLLRDLASLLRAHLRERGIAVRWDPELEGIGRTVRRSDLVMPVVTAAHQLTLALPTGFEGALELQVPRIPDLLVSLCISPTPGCLPFDVDATAAIAVAASTLADRPGAVTATPSGTGILISLPAEVSDA